MEEEEEEEEEQEEKEVMVDEKDEEEEKEDEHKNGKWDSYQRIAIVWCIYLKVTIINEYKFWWILKIVDIAGINFSDFAITFSINSKICDKF